MAEYGRCTYEHKDLPGGRVVFPSFVNEEDLRLLWDTFRVESTDVFVVSFPKSGTTWVNQIVHLLRTRGEQGPRVLSRAVPFLEGANRYGGLDGLLAEMPEGRRIFHSHLPFALMPKPQVEEARSAKYIYVTRHPKDVCVSYFFHAQAKMNYEGSWKEFVTLFSAGEVGYGGIVEHVGEWVRAQGNGQVNVMHVTYEDLSSNPGEQVRRIAAFLEIEANDRLVDLVVSESSFDSMEKNNLANLSWVPQREGVPQHMRKGVVRDWPRHFSEEQNAELEQALGASVARYAEYAALYDIRS
eukprot:scaffold3036_cov414-Prasinococcus_capsulatus_cf.AAC.11